MFQRCEFHTAAMIKYIEVPCRHWIVIMKVGTSHIGSWKYQIDIETFRMPQHWQCVLQISFFILNALITFNSVTPNVVIWRRRSWQHWVRKWLSHIIIQRQAITWTNDEWITLKPQGKNILTQFESRHEHFLSMIRTSKCRLRNGDHFVSVLVC